MADLENIVDHNFSRAAKAVASHLETLAKEKKIEVFAIKPDFVREETDTDIILKAKKKGCLLEPLGSPTLEFIGAHYLVKYVASGSMYLLNCYEIGGDVSGHGLELQRLRQVKALEKEITALPKFISLDPKQPYGGMDVSFAKELVDARLSLETIRSCESYNYLKISGAPEGLLFQEIYGLGKSTSAPTGT